MCCVTEYEMRPYKPMAARIQRNQTLGSVRSDTMAAVMKPIAYYMEQAGITVVQLVKVETTFGVGC